MRNERKIAWVSVGNKKFTTRQVKIECSLNGEVSVDTVHRALGKNNLNRCITVKEKHYYPKYSGIENLNSQKHI